MSGRSAAPNLGQALDRIAAPVQAPLESIIIDDASSVASISAAR